MTNLPEKTLSPSVPKAPQPDTDTLLTQDPYAALTLPEDSSLTPQTLAALKQIAQAAGLPAGVVGQWIALEDARAKQAAQAADQARQDEQAAWIRQTQEAFGEHWQEEVSCAVHAADVFGGAPLRELLETTGLGNHPVMVRTFHGIGKRMSEDLTPGGSGTAPADKTFTQALYGKNE